MPESVQGMDIIIIIINNSNNFFKLHTLSLLIRINCIIDNNNNNKL